MNMRRHLRKIGLWISALAFCAFLIVASGIVPIKASSGHWRVTEWLLHFAMRRSIATHSLGIEVPPLDDPVLVMKGAGHFEFGCRPCHGSAEFSEPVIPHQMTPHPPYLPPSISKWDPEELFYIVKHGVKFTGMPAWPSRQRDDEVWALVAFLRRLPSLNEVEYRRLAVGDNRPEKGPSINELDVGTAPQAVIQNCSSCHAVDGRGRGAGAFPRLAGQSAKYMENALRAYANEERHSGIMQPIAASLGEPAMRELSRYYASLGGSPAAPVREADRAAIERGALIAENGIPKQRVASCTDCHGPGGAHHKKAYPLLAGQYADYLLLQLQLFKDGRRGGSEYAHIMRKIAARLQPDQMRDVALYYESIVDGVDKNRADK